MRIPFASWRHDEPRLVPAPPPGVTTGQKSPKGTVRPPVVTTPQELPPPPVYVPDAPPGPGQAPAWAVDRITQLTRLLAAEQSTTAALRKQLAQRPAPAGPVAGLRGMFRLAACETDRHLIDAIAADRDRLERVNDRLRAENQQLRVKAEL